MPENAWVSCFDYMPGLSICHDIVINNNKLLLFTNVILELLFATIFFFNASWDIRKTKASKLSINVSF